MLSHVVNVSGGKDSGATLLLALERAETHGWERLQGVFADTGHEDPATIEYVAALSERTGAPIVTVKADFSAQLARRRESILKEWPEGPQREAALAACEPTGVPMLDMCVAKRRFPSPDKRFCTETLKLRPIEEQVYAPIWREGHTLVAWTGLRAEESKARATLRKLTQVRSQRSAYHAYPYWYYLPLLHWKLADVWNIHKRHGLPLNPLYAQGYRRVGCMPCIYATKLDLLLTSEHHPEAVDRVREWETRVAAVRKPGSERPTLIPRSKYTPYTLRPHGQHGIDAACAWAHTARGGRQTHMFAADDAARSAQDAERTLSEWSLSCTEQGLCE